MKLCCALQTRVVACGICKNYIHESCFAEWKKQKKTLRQDVTCVYCRCATAPSHPYCVSLFLTDSSTLLYYSCNVSKPHVYSRCPERERHWCVVTVCTTPVHTTFPRYKHGCEVHHPRFVKAWQPGM